jgi:hypothetical protein
MTDDLVKRLLRVVDYCVLGESGPEVETVEDAACYYICEKHSALLQSKAAEARIEELEAALREIANPDSWEGMDWVSHGVPKWIARAALENKDD